MVIILMGGARELAITHRLASVQLSRESGWQTPLVKYTAILH